MYLPIVVLQSKQVPTSKNQKQLIHNTKKQLKSVKLIEPEKCELKFIIVNKR